MSGVSYAPEDGGLRIEERSSALFPKTYGGTAAGPIVLFLLLRKGFMKLIHTSDWHLGNQLNGNIKRTEEFDSLLDWMVGLVKSENVEVFLIAGDIFDSVNPPTEEAVKRYYNFIGKLSRTACRHLIVIGGNHDSALRLDAPKELYPLIAGLNICVVGGIDPKNPEREVLTLNDGNGVPEAIVCAVPYVPDKFLRTAEFGESNDEKIAKMLAGLKAHYQEVGELAEKEQARVQREFGKTVPVIVTGHLFTKNSDKLKLRDDGVRELTLGGIHGVGLDVFPACADYVALGHIHRPYAVDGEGRVRYSGSILPIGFDETEYRKTVTLVEFNGGGRTNVSEVEIPLFRRMKNIAASSRDEIFSAIDRFKEECGGEPGCFKVSNTGEPIPGLYRQVLQSVEGSKLICCGVVNRKNFSAPGIAPAFEDESVEDLTEIDAFNRLMEVKKIPEKERDALRNRFIGVMNEDSAAEMSRE